MTPDTCCCFNAVSGTGYTLSSFAVQQPLLQQTTCFDLQNEIIDYDAHRITPEMRSAVNRLLAQKGASFEQANIYRVSQAAAPLAAWVTANLQYADVLQKVAPLEQELGGLTANFNESQVRQESPHEAVAPCIALTRAQWSAQLTALSCPMFSQLQVTPMFISSLTTFRQEGMGSCLPCTTMLLSLPSVTTQPTCHG